MRDFGLTAGPFLNTCFSWVLGTAIAVMGVMTVMLCTLVYTIAFHV